MSTNIIAILGAVMIVVALAFWVASERAGAQDDPASPFYWPEPEDYAVNSSHLSYLEFWDHAGAIDDPIH